MKTYILLTFDRDRQVGAVHALGADCENKAVTEAHALIRTQSNVSSYELWNGGRKIAVFSEGRRADTSVVQSSQI